MIKNNVTRMLDAHHIYYKVHELPAEKLSAVQVAAILDIPPERVYKTIVVMRLNQGKDILAVVPGPSEVDLKALAKVVGEKKVKLATERQAEEKTGLQVGGISPLALINRGFQVVLDAAAQTQTEIYISGGRRGLDVSLSPQDIIRLTNAKIANISQ
jgi:Cys-tRNA(Pro)/Cys-tRNA(Cys) deacylase